ncbi:unnamed protein product [Amoebophrya sp. A25]|nr:unnamed protein product [Amoebophrya sp. A25]|eukprot:GSA25T00016513001.1
MNMFDYRCSTVHITRLLLILVASLGPGTVRIIPAAAEDGKRDEGKAAATPGTNIYFDSDGALPPERRWRLQGKTGLAVFMTGLSGAGKSTIAKAVERKLVESGVPAFRLDGDNLRHGLNSDLGFSEKDRAENVRRVSEVSKLMVEAGSVVISALIAPNAGVRGQVRESHAKSGLPFVEVFVNASLAEAERRDVKGLYARARAGKIKEFTGISAPYDVPENPDIELRTDDDSAEESAAKLFQHIMDRIKVEQKQEL